MPDILLRWDQEHGRADWLLAPGDLASGNDLATSITVSLFTDRQAGDTSGLPPEEGPAEGWPDRDRRGWWADAYRDRPLGSRLWLLDRAAKTPATLRRAEDYAREALAWLVSDGVAARLDIRAAWVGPNALGLRVIVTQPSGRAVAFDWAWRN